MGRNSCSWVRRRIPEDKWGHHSLREEEWDEMHEKSKEVSKKFGVTNAGQKVVGLGKLAWRKSLQEDLFSAEKRTGKGVRHKVSASGKPSRKEDRHPPILAPVPGSAKSRWARRKTVRCVAGECGRPMAVLSHLSRGIGAFVETGHFCLHFCFFWRFFSSLKFIVDFDSGACSS